MSQIKEEPYRSKQIEMTESEKLAYSKAVEEIEGDSFVQHSFKSSSGDKKSQSSANDQSDETFNFGTQAEVTAKGGGKFIPLSDDSLFSPHLFGDPEEREEKYFRRIFSLRQKAVLGEPL